MNFIKKNHILLFFAAWLLINLIQAGATELFDDEAYYWIYSQYPAWGYFDHPPMIAWLIKAGYAIFPNELGVRFFIVLLNTATLILIRELITKKNDLLFYAIAASIAVAQIGGIIAVPDIPLLFFVALFFWLYRRFAEKTTLFNSFLLGISIALMLYSKYHGILIVFFTLLSNPKLFTRYQTYITTLVALLLFAPHLYWQYTHGFPSVQFHLFERNAVSYRFSFTSEYLLGQLALAGPLIGWLLLWAAFNYKSISLSEKAMKFSLVGIYLVFLISTFKGRAEANWTIPAFVSLIVLSHQYLFERPKLVKWVYWAAPITLLIVFAGRIYMMLDVPSSPRLSKDEFHANKPAAAAVKQKAGDLPVVVIDSYQKPSKYWFYSKEKSFALNTPNYRRNNFNYWPIEDSLIGRPVYVIGPATGIFADTIPAQHFSGNMGLRIENYYSFSKLRISNIREELITPQLIKLTCQIQSPKNYLSFFQQRPYDTASVQLTVYDKRGNVAAYLSSGFLVKQIIKEELPVTISCKHQLTPGKYAARLAVSSCIPGYPSLNSGSFKIEIK